MEQHPVPQQISSYQFKLVGDMTLKQFFEIAAGVVIGLIFYSLPFPAFIKWPLIIVSVLLGAAFAFLPIEERPLEQWLMAFIRSIYQPTKFYWKKAETQTQYFLAPATVKTQTDSEPVVSSQPPNTTFLNNLESGEKAFFSNITRLFNVAGSAKPATTSTSVPETKPEVATVVNPVIITPATREVQKPAPISRPIIAQQVAAQTQPASVQATPPAPPKQVVVPPTAPIQVEKSKEPVPTVEPAAPVAAPITIKTEAIGQILPNQPVQISPTPMQAQSIQFSPEAAPPATPTQANIVVGQVMDNQGKIVEGAILEIKDLQGRPVRALKSNKVGHFFIVTALPAGQYQLTAEKEGLEFSPIQVDANGQIIEPIAIKSKNTLI